MGLFSKFNEKIGSGTDIEGADARKGFYWVEDQKGNNVMWRLPRNVMWNDNVLVREDEYGVFFRDGKALQVFDRPDRYALTTQNLPVLKNIAGTLVGNVQIGEFFWVQKREFRDKFGTNQPLAFRDTDFGVVQLRMFGQFSYKVTDPLLTITEFIGTKGLTTSEEIVSWLKDQIVMILNDTLGELKSKKQMGILDMPAYLQEIEQLCLAKLMKETEIYGLKIMKFTGLNINMPEEVQEAINKRGAMSALGVNYIQYQSGKAIEGIGEGAAQGGGEGAGFAMMGAGMGAGLGMGNMMAQGMSGMGGGQPAPFGGQVPAAATVAAPQPAAATAAPQPGDSCPKCGNTVPTGTKFCPECGSKLGQSFCSECGAKVMPGMKFCAECGNKL
ncbi:SPFH domain-containing protein [Methanocorpusculum vombati]|uniref:SPFH domain-containing protein n=1 Tax=Methanocorpusculum vombati TaxID=3002864 RepID=A0ABT4IL84_9EURY|nr:SPFH domain-containing protein [Methanocorpusculum vombati]MCZ9318776.1 SPFH domain-containing protein [Methanocorpusculum sp.]MCZ0862513.1 SPFH domain-containing protein [Methanocorpusculum vombati]MDE2521418.1 SPFH domain-containing protein [Methanocorpusculum sp.]MDE2533904.1 SPFH domain-containing protein [Methanocorpusculum sp.]MDE2546761.1 SPFH domain-containing protein [Methanocorpusculum sp.]